MDFLKKFALSWIPSWTSSWMNVYIFTGLCLVVLSVIIYISWRWVYGSKTMESFASEKSEACNPHIENACGNDANCQPDETGESGICFPKEEDVAEGYVAEAAPEPDENVETE